MNTKIEWTEQTWNPIVGCSIVSPGCTNCYAMRMAARIIAMAGTSKTGLQYDKTIKDVKGNPVWTGVINLAPEHVLLAPLRRNKPTTYFVNSMGDLFHEDCPDEWIDKVFAVMALCPQHTFQGLTKRAERMRAYIIGLSQRHTPDGTMQLSPQTVLAVEALAMVNLEGRGKHQNANKIVEMGALGWPLPNVYLGVSTERQQEADERIPLLLQTPAAIRFVSYEPALGPLTISYLEWARLDWLICGGESGHGARPMNPKWARSIRDQCQAAGVKFFFKQHGEFVSVSEVEGEGRHFHFPDGRTVRRLGKKRAGRLLDGVEHNEMPEPSPS